MELILSTGPPVDRRDGGALTEVLRPPLHAHQSDTREACTTLLLRDCLTAHGVVNARDI